MKKIFSLILAVILLFSSSVYTSASTPSPKEEVVYGLLNHDGSIKNLYVVNIFEGGYITDYGNYDEIKNLTTKEPMTKSGDMITINTKASKFYYQGNLPNKELPWNINIRYYLNDNELSGKDLAGSSGRLKITISVTQNKNSDKNFFENYGLQISLLLDNNLCSEIEAEKATVAEAGGKKQVNFTVLPGNNFEGIVSADVKNFEMDSISINAIRMKFDVSLDTSKYTGQFSDLIKAVEELDNGAGEILAGLKSLSDGTNEYTEGVSAFNEGIKELSKGSDDIYKGASAISNGLSELAKQNDSIISGANALQQAAFDAVNAEISSMGLSIPKLTPENYNNVLSNIQELFIIKLQLDGVVQFVQGLKSYTDAVSSLQQGAEKLSNGSKQFRDSAGELNTASVTIYDGASKINDGIKELYEGMASYKEGTGTFKNKTAGINNEIDEQIDKLIKETFGSDEKINSFVSDKNTDITSLQFVLKTDPIKITTVPITEIAEPVKLTFWQKLLKLFGLYKG